MHYLVWIGITFCITQSAIFSGLNLAFFSISRLKLEIEASNGNANAAKVLAMRNDSNFLLSTILWGNVGINVILTLLSNSVMAGLSAFMFSTILITFLGEIIPQAYFSRHALKTAALLAPVMKFYQIILFPLTKPTSLALDKWLGPEAIQYFHEKDLEELLRMHINSPESDIDLVEGRGALNFLAIDDLPLHREGELLDPKSIISLDFIGERPVFPDFSPRKSDKFLSAVNQSKKKWVVITDKAQEPRMVLDADGFLRDALLLKETAKPYRYCHRPIIVREMTATLGDIIPLLKVSPTGPGDDVIDQDIILVWGDAKKVITGSDILGRLLRGIVL